MLPAAAMLTGTVSGSRAGDANGLQAINGLEKSLVLLQNVIGDIFTCYRNENGALIENSQYIIDLT